MTREPSNSRNEPWSRPVAKIKHVLAMLSVVAFGSAVGSSSHMPMTHAEFGAFFKKDVADNLELVKAAKIPTQ